jgi:hypothetical protein
MFNQINDAKRSTSQTINLEEIIHTQSSLHQIPNLATMKTALHQMFRGQLGLFSIGTFNENSSELV